MVRTVSFSGHRTYKDDETNRHRLDAMLASCHAAGYRRFLSGMAEGFDLAAAEAVLRLRARHPDVWLGAFVPFRGQARRFSEIDRARYERILATADECRILSERYEGGCFHARNDLLVEEGELLLCYYDGSPGGTRHTLRKAHRKGIRIVNLYQEAGTLFPNDPL